jgi:class 3 adenylate cyclase
MNVQTLLMTIILMTIIIPLLIISILASINIYLNMVKQTSEFYKTLMIQAMDKMDIHYEKDLEALSDLASSKRMIKVMNNREYQNIIEEVNTTDLILQASPIYENPIRAIIESRLEGTCFIYENDRKSLFDNTPYKVYRLTPSVEPDYQELIQDPLYLSLIRNPENTAVFGKLKDGVIKSLGGSRSVVMIYSLKNPEVTPRWNKFILLILPPDVISKEYESIQQLKYGTLYFIDHLGNMMNTNHPGPNDDYEYDQKSMTYINDHEIYDPEMSYSDYRSLNTDPGIFNSIQYKKIKNRIEKSGDTGGSYFINYKNKSFMVQMTRSQKSGIEAVFFYPTKRMLAPVYSTILIILIATALIITIFSVITLRISRQFTDPIFKIIRHSEKFPVTMGYVELDVHHFFGEFKTLGTKINQLNHEIDHHQKNLLELIDKYSRFLPSNYFDLMKKKNVLELNLGDQISQEMTIMFCDIRDFTALSEDMSPKENFDFLNSYYKKMGPLVRKNRGFIDKYIGDAIMALFPQDPNDAIESAIDMIDELDQFNRHRIMNNYPPVLTGTGINTGLMMAGIIGENERYDSTVISDAVNLAARIENLNKDYGSRIIFSMYTLIYVNKDKYFYRVLDKVQVKGKTENTVIFEILNHLPPRDFDLKMQTKDDFETALQLMQENRITEALKIYKAIRKINPDDKAVIHQIDRCHMLEIGSSSR